MPYKSDAQRKYFEGCRSNPTQMKGKCPPKKVLDEFHRASYPKQKPRKVKYH